MSSKTVIILAAFSLAAVACAPQGETPADTRSATAPPAMKMTTDIPASITAPDRVETSIGTLEYFDGVPKEGTVTKLYDPENTL